MKTITTTTWAKLGLIQAILIRVKKFMGSSLK